MNSKTATNYAVGAGTYYLFVLILAFYPAFVMMIQCGSIEEDGGLWRGFIALALTFGVILVLYALFIVSEKIIFLLLLIGLYLFFLCPFIQYIGYYINVIDGKEIVWTGFNWIFF